MEVSPSPPPSALFKMVKLCISYSDTSIINLIIICVRGKGGGRVDVVLEARRGIFLSVYISLGIR